MEWTRQRVFECSVVDAWGPTRKRVICRQRDDGVLYALTITVGHPYFDTRENIVREFARFASEITSVHPCTEEEFNATFLMNLRERDGEEIVDGPWYSFLVPDVDAARKWDERQQSRIPLQRIDETIDVFPRNSKRGLP